MDDNAIEDMSDVELLKIEAEADRIELSRAKDNFAVYCGLHIPSEVEKDDLPRLHELSLDARYVPAVHHQLICQLLQALDAGVLHGRPFHNLIIQAPPGSAKSTYASHLFPSWYLGRHPKHNVIQGSQTDELAMRFGRRARNTFASEVHKNVFGGAVAQDSRAAGAWETSEGGEYYATGVQPFAGRRADLLICDDLVRGFEDADSPGVLDKIWNWYKSDACDRLKPGGKQVMIMTRWHENDPVGRIIPRSFAGKTGWVKSMADGQMWYVLALKAVIETQDDERNDPLGRKLGDFIWPEWFTREMLDASKARNGLRGWYGKYQQTPRPDGGAILLSDWWRPWTQELPKVEYLIQVYDTAFEEGEENDYSARTTWGIFQNTETLQKEGGQSVQVTRYCCILLEAWRDKCEFTELREEAKRSYRSYKPDKVLIEKKASGHSLLQELRRAIPVQAANQKWMGRSKRARAYGAQPALEDGCVFYPCKFRDGKWMPYSWCMPVIDEVSSYPDGEYKDWADTCLAAGTLIYCANGLKRIERISTGDFVMTHHGRFRRVTAISSRMSDHIHNLKAKCLDELLITGNHPVLAMDISAPDNAKRGHGHMRSDGTDWTPAEQMVPRSGVKRGLLQGMTLPIPTSVPTLGSLDLLYHLRDVIGCGVDLAKDTHWNGKPVNRNVPLSYSTGWMFGLYLSEGCVTTGRTEKLQYVRWACDKDAIEIVSRIVHSTFGVAVQEADGSGTRIANVGSAPLAQLFSQFGCSSESKLIPSWCFSTPEEFRDGIVDGVVYGDGNYDYRRGRYRVTSVSKSLLWGMRLLLGMKGISAKFGAGKKAGVRNIFGRDMHCLESFTLHWSTRGWPVGVFDEDHVGFWVESNERINKPTRVFNLQVDEDESYVTTGGTVHNCVHAWLWLRQHWHLKLTDEDEDKKPEQRNIRMFG